MPTHPGDASGHVAPVGHPELLFRAIGFLGLIACGVVAAADDDGWKRLAPALACIAFAVVGVIAALAELLTRDDLAGPPRRSRPWAAALGTLAVAAFVLALTLPVHGAAAMPATATPAGQAADTVRQFLVTAVVDDNPYLACQYLTGSQQRAIARLAAAPSCRDAFTAATPAFAGIQSAADVHALRIGVRLLGDRATVSVAGHGARPTTFVLRRATPAELNAFQAPQAPWRIDSGATAVLGG